MDECKTVESAGARQGAWKGVPRVDHADIERFITAKGRGDLSYLNLSVGVIDAFIRAAENKQTFELVNQAALASAVSLQRVDGM